MEQPESTCIQQATNFLWPTKRTLILFGIFSIAPILAISGTNYYIAPFVLGLEPTTLDLVFLPFTILMMPYLSILFVGYAMAGGSPDYLLLAGLGFAVEFVFLYVLSSAVVHLWNRKKRK